MIRGEYEAYSGHSHLPAPARRQACLPLPAGRRGQAGKTDAAIPKKPLMIIFLPDGRRACPQAGLRLLSEQSRILN